MIIKYVKNNKTVHLVALYKLTFVLSEMNLWLLYSFGPEIALPCSFK